MSDYEDYLISRIHATIIWKDMVENHTIVPWDNLIQDEINTFSPYYEIEVHLMTIKNHFKGLIGYSETLGEIKICLKEQSNINQFSRCLFNRVKQLIKNR
jgi:hypothetical protein